MKTLILGGARSGKSRLAESLAVRSGLPVTYFATANASDDEMRARIEQHRARRPTHWTVIEEPLALATALQTRDGAGNFLLVDCLTLWLTNLLLSNDEALLARERKALVIGLSKLKSDTALVSNETGMGITPLGALTRRFVDEAGALHQELAQRCERVVFTVAGLPSVLKGEPL